MIIVLIISSSSLLVLFRILGAPVVAHSEGHFVAGQKMDDSAPGLARSNAKSFLRAGSTATLVDSSPQKSFFQDAQSRSTLTLSPCEEPDQPVLNIYADDDEGDEGEEPASYGAAAASQKEGPEIKDAHYYRTEGWGWVT